MSEVKEIELPGDTPDCQLDCDNPAEYDMPTIYGPWAYVCEKHYQSHTPAGAGAIGTRITWVVESGDYFLADPAGGGEWVKGESDE